MTSATPPQHRNLIGTRIADGRLELLSVLGLGAYGVVYLARDVSSLQHARKFLGGSSQGTGGHGDYYAVKCLNKVGLDNRQRAFQRRETLLHTMTSSHPNVVSLHCIIDEPHDPNVYVIMDYCPDGDLFSMITEKMQYSVDPEPYVRDPVANDGRPMPEDPAYTRTRLAMDVVVKDVFNQILDAVEHCHSMGIYHRDLKPENILCMHNGRRVLLADFGLATGDRWSNDFGCGSSFYMGPECQGGLSARLSHYNTAANDVWSLGVILINLICGRNPWKQASTQDETFREYLKDPDFIKKVLPISEETNAVLKRIFTFRSESRCSIRSLRRWVNAIPRLQATALELWHRHHSVPMVATDHHLPKAQVETTPHIPSDALASLVPQEDMDSSDVISEAITPPSHSSAVPNAGTSHFSQLSLDDAYDQCVQEQAAKSAKRAPLRDTAMNLYLATVDEAQSLRPPIRAAPESSGDQFAAKPKPNSDLLVPDVPVDGYSETSQSASDTDFTLTPVSSPDDDDSMDASSVWRSEPYEVFSPIAAQ